MNSFKHNFYPLLKLTLPLSLTGLLSSAVFFFETLFLARVSTEVLAAGALVSWLSGTFIAIIFGLLSSINILVAHQHGAKNPKNIALIARDGLYLALLLAPPIIILFWNMSPVFLLFGQHKPVVLLAQSYLHAWAFGILPQLIMIALLEVIMGLGHMRTILISTTLEVALSILFSFLLIFGKYGFPALGIAGAGFGMSISYWITAIGLIIFVLTQKEYATYFRPFFKFGKSSYLRQLLSIGTPMGFMYCIEVAFFFALILFMGTFGAQVLAANQIVMQYNGILISIIFSFAQAVTIRMGHLLGANDKNAAQNAGYAGIYMSGLFMLIAAFFFCCFPHLLISLDFDIHQAKNAEIIHLATNFFYICALFQIFEAMRIAYFGALRAVQDTLFTLLISLFSFWGIALPVGYWMATRLDFSGSGLWWGMALGAALSIPLLEWRFRSKIREYQK